MLKFMTIRIKPLVVSLLISLGVGGISAWLTSGSMQVYQEAAQPPLSPPGIVFPIVWTVLFILMGISAYLVFISPSQERKKALALYGVQLAVNFLWPVFFFNCQWFLFAFFWLLLLWGLILAMIVSFSRISKAAGLLQIPYLLWVTFAGYLNLGIALLNR